MQLSLMPLNRSSFFDEGLSRLPVLILTGSSTLSQCGWDPAICRMLRIKIKQRNQIKKKNNTHNTKIEKKRDVDLPFVFDCCSSHAICWSTRQSIDPAVPKRSVLAFLNDIKASVNWFTWNWFVARSALLWITMSPVKPLASPRGHAWARMRILRLVADTLSWINHFNDRLLIAIYVLSTCVGFTMG